MSSTLFNDMRQQHTYNNVQPILHEPPVVYGNLPQYYQQQQQQQQQQAIMQYPPQNVIYGPSAQIYYTQNEMMVKSSSSSISSSSPRTPPRLHSSSPPTRLVTPLTPPSSTEERVKETIARANAIPVEFYQTEFLEYSKKTYDGRHQKRKRTDSDDDNLNCKKLNREEQDDDPEERLNTSELRRQIHIQSEQKRRAQIKDGFDVLKSHLPGCSNKKLSKAALLTRTVQQLEHMKKMQVELLAEVERLAQENTNLKMMRN